MYSSTVVHSYIISYHIIAEFIVRLLKKGTSLHYESPKICGKNTKKNSQQILKATVK